MLPKKSEPTYCVVPTRPQNKFPPRMFSVWSGPKTQTLWLFP